MYMDPWGMGTQFKNQSRGTANKLFYYKCFPLRVYVTLLYFTDLVRIFGLVRTRRTFWRYSKNSIFLLVYLNFKFLMFKKNTILWDLIRRIRNTEFFLWLYNILLNGVLCNFIHSSSNLMLSSLVTFSFLLKPRQNSTHSERFFPQFLLAGEMPSHTDTHGESLSHTHTHIHSRALCVYCKAINSLDNNFSLAS